MGYKAVLFDMDGTVLDTLDDLTAAVNHSLEHFGLPRVSREKVRQSLGNGAARLCRCCMPQGSDEALARELIAYYMPWYDIVLMVLGVDVRGIHFRVQDGFFLLSAACVTANAFMDQGRQPHRIEHISRIIACSTIGSKRYINACLEAGRYRRDPGTKIQIRCGIMTDRNTSFCKKMYFILCKMYTVHRKELIGQEADFIKEIYDIPAVIPSTHIVIFQCLIKMHGIAYFLVKTVLQYCPVSG